MEDLKSPLHNKPDYLVCTCMGVMASEIREEIAQGSSDFEALSEVLMVGTGCSSCVDEIGLLLTEASER